MSTDIEKYNFKHIARKLGLGVAFYRLYYAPKGYLEKLMRWGFINTYLTNVGKKRMENATFQLPSISVNQSSDILDIYFMTGKKYWYQTCFCAYSMIDQTQTNIRPIIYDDGTLEEIHINEIIRIFPNAKILYLKDIEPILDNYLPTSKFPYLRERRLKQPLLRKLTDFHVGSQGWKLFLDSDMLFFKPPTFLLNWLKFPDYPCYMVDIFNAYGYPQDLMTSLAGAKIPDLVNIGIFGLKSEDIDWEQIEYWLKNLIETEGTHYNVTQCLSAMFLAGKKCTVVPAEDYIVMPNQEEVIQPQAVLHHYVADSKPGYFRYAWKHII
ncbi:glycosyl transferase [Anabaena subtropica]|uniref:Glycosyl transferase n=1 Tax=Anabaena subtropica FACHB-260 TaxID=2692884 RepID=A0ABR8CUL4_9NOST|nr:glycosyl transferase [Anabaena subtropica]MBD2345480.1 glycosyl transferase [Anabaena subtropica FACHB-260]